MYHKSEGCFSFKTEVRVVGRKCRKCLLAGRTPYLRASIPAGFLGRHIFCSHIFIPSTDWCQLIITLGVWLMLATYIWLRIPQAD